MNHDQKLKEAERDLLIYKIQMYEADFKWYSLQSTSQYVLYILCIYHMARAGIEIYNMQWTAITYIFIFVFVLWCAFFVRKRRKDAKEELMKLYARRMTE